MTDKITFKEFVHLQKITDSPTGDFIGDVKRDKEFKDYVSWDRVSGYLSFKGACPEAMRVAKRLYKKWHDIYSDDFGLEIFCEEIILDIVLKYEKKN